MNNRFYRSIIILAWLLWFANLAFLLLMQRPHNLIALIVLSIALGRDVAMRVNARDWKGGDE